MRPRARGQSPCWCSWGPQPGYAPLHSAVAAAFAEIARTGGKDGNGLVIVFAAGNYDAPLNATLTTPVRWGRDGYVRPVRLSQNPAPAVVVDMQDRTHVSIMADPARSSDEDRFHVRARPARASATAPDARGRVPTTTRNGLGDPSTDPLYGHGVGSYDAQGHSEWFGHGRVNAAAAVAEAVRRLPASPGVIDREGADRIADHHADRSGISSTFVVAEVCVTARCPAGGAPSAAGELE